MVGRYRLESLEREVSGAVVWRACDDSLNRHVTVWELANPVREADLLDALRSAIRVPDPHLTQIFEVDLGSRSPFLATEWTPGWDLDELLVTELPSHQVALSVTLATADVLTAAHAAGRPHLCLTPSAVRWTSTRSVKVAGLGIEAALAGRTASDPVAADTRALAGLLYALLTGYWTGPDPSVLPAAPRSHGELVPPGQVRSGIPGVLDAIIARTLLPNVRPRISSPAQFAWELQVAQHVLGR